MPIERSKLNRLLAGFVGAPLAVGAFALSVGAASSASAEELEEDAISKKRKTRRGGPAPAHEAIAQLTSPPCSLAQFASNHLHSVYVFCENGARLHVTLQVATHFGNSFLHVRQVSSHPCRTL